MRTNGGLLFALHRFAFQQSAEQVAAHMSSRRCLQTAGRALWTMAFSFLLFLVSVSAARARFSLQQIMSSPFPSQLVAAKTGGRVAWVFNLKGVRNVWISDATAFVARQVTHYSSDDGMPLTTLRLTPDGRTVLYVRGSATNSAGELANPTGNSKQPKQQVWAVDVDRGEPRLLGDMDSARTAVRTFRCPLTGNPRCGSLGTSFGLRRFLAFSQRTSLPTRVATIPILNGRPEASRLPLSATAVTTVMSSFMTSSDS